jgi:multidrug efflux system outer membrane protein
MNRLLPLLLTLFAVPAHALTLQEAMTQAADTPAVHAAHANAEAARLGAQAQQRPAYLPVVGLSAKYNHHSDPLTLDTPLGPFQSQPGHTAAVGVVLTQPILRPSAWYAGAEAHDDAQAAQLQAHRTRETHVARVAEAWIAIRALDAQRDATAALSQQLTRQRDRLRVLHEQGTLLKADLLQIELALSRTQQQHRALADRRTLATTRLGVLLGGSEPIEPTGDAHLEPAAAETQRRDLDALNAHDRALAHKQDAVWGDLIPTISAQAQWTAANTDLNERTWYEGTIQLQWVPFAAGTRAPRQHAIAAERRAHQQHITDAQHGITLEVQAAQSELRIAQDALTVASTAIVQAEESRRLEEARYRAERATISDLIAAESTLQTQRTQRALAELAIVRATLHLHLARGTL